MNERGPTERAFKVCFEPPDLVGMSFTGILDEAGAIQVTSELTSYVGHLPGFFVLADFTRLESVTAEGRKASVEGTRSVRLRAAAILGASFHVRALTTLIVMGSRLLRSDPPPAIAFFNTEGEAKTWLDGQRSLVRL